MQKIFRSAYLVCALLLVGCQTHPDRSSRGSSPVVPVATKEPIHRVSKPSHFSGQLSTNLFNGTDLEGWKVTNFGGHGEVMVKNGEIMLEMGAELTGITWTNEAILPSTNYEIELESMKRVGGDFFTALTFPVNDSFCSLIVGGWGGSVVGLSSLDGMDASENDTSQSLYFERNRWFHIRIRVTPERIVTWIDQEKIIDVDISQRKVGIRIGEIQESIPLGIATWQTSASLKNIRLKTL